MKKLFTLLAVSGLAIASQAAALDWKYDATASDVGQTVYLMLGTEAVQEWENLDAVQGAAIDSAEVAKSGRVYNAKGSVNSAKVTKDSASVYFVVVSADKETFGVTSVSDMTASVYDPSNQESSPGENSSLSSGSIAKSGIAWGTGGTGGGDDPGTGGGDDPGTGGGDDPGTGGGDDPGTGGGDDPGTGGGESGGVPEPTSGILLMIGGAALALRRR